MISVYIEFLKTRRKKLLILVLSLSFTEVLWGLWSFSDISYQELAHGWKCIIYQFTILNCIILPVSIAVVASRICSVEHSGNALRLIRTITSSQKIFDTKFIYGSFYVIITLLIQVFFMIILGNIKNFQDVFSVKIFIYYFIFNLIVSLTILVFQQTLSLIFENQIISISIGLCGSFLGLFSLFLSNNLNKFILWAYYGVLLFVRMEWFPESKTIIYNYIPIDIVGVYTIVSLFFIIYFTGRILFTRKDI